jgi:hypothetical protein
MDKAERIASEATALMPGAKAVMHCQKCLDDYEYRPIGGAI